MVLVDGRHPCTNAGDARDAGSIPGLRRSAGKRSGKSQYCLPGKFYGQRSLAGYNPWGHTESGKTEQLSTPNLINRCMNLMNRLVPNRERSISRPYIVTLLI